MAQPGPSTILSPGHLLAVAAHDLKNPVSGIMSAAEYLLEDASGLLESEHLAVLQSIESSSRQMLAVIEDLSEIAVLETEGIRLDDSPADFNELIRKATDQVRAAAGPKEIRIELATDIASPKVDMDSARIQQAVQRMLALAIRNAPQAGRIGIRMSVDGAHARLILQTKVVEDSITRAEAGANLTIALIHRIAEAHGGTFEHAGGAGGGQMFQLTLPVSGRPRSKRP